MFIQSVHFFSTSLVDLNREEYLIILKMQMR